MYMGASVRTSNPGVSMSVSHRKPPSVPYFARIAGIVGNISFGRAFLVAVEVRNVEVSPYARQLE